MLKPASASARRTTRRSTSLSSLPTAAGAVCPSITTPAQIGGARARRVPYQIDCTPAQRFTAFSYELKKPRRADLPQPAHWRPAPADEELQASRTTCEDRSAESARTRLRSLRPRAELDQRAKLEAFQRGGARVPRPRLRSARRRYEQNDFVRLGMICGARSCSRKALSTSQR